MLGTAIKAAKSAAEILLENFGKISAIDVREKKKNDFLTFVDEQAEQRIINIIHDSFPDHAILAEESGQQLQNTEFLWIIDPLDGTKNYISGIPVFGISIALKYKDDLILGVVLDPLRNELYWAEKNKGAFLNGKSIKVSINTQLEDCLLATGFPFKYKDHLKNYMTSFEHIFRRVSGVRRMGAACIDLAYLAAGRFDGFWEIGLSPWDVAAGSLIIREAGGKFSDFWGQQDHVFSGYFVASNGIIHKQLINLLQNNFNDYIKIE
jgi:myo-inositol-1(or 4)-monophosphatase